MDSDLISALIGFGGGLVGVAVGAFFQKRVTHSQLCRETTLNLYDRLDDPDIMEARIRADEILGTNLRSESPKGLCELYGNLTRDDWQHISRTRHFLDQIGLLQRIGYLDKTIAVPLFASFVDYWTTNYFIPLEQLDIRHTGNGASRPRWRVTAQQLKELFPKET